MIVAVDQPNYIPWKGYFDLIHDVDLFVFYNDVQYTPRDWRNRNKIITSQGEKWLTVPVGQNRNRLISEVRIDDHKWQKKHFDTIQYAYGRSPFYKKYLPFLQYVYLEKEWDYLYELDQYMIENIATNFLGIKTKFVDSRDFKKSGMKHEKLLSLLDSLGSVDVYESGPAAKDYIVTDDYKKKGIGLAWKNYDGYPVYDQHSELFSHNVSILDLLFNVGDESPYYIWGWREESGALSYFVN